MMTLVGFLGFEDGIVWFILWVSGTGSHGTTSRPNGPRLLGLEWAASLFLYFASAFGAYLVLE